MKYSPLLLIFLLMVFALPASAQLSQPMLDALSRSQLGANAELLATPEDKQTISDYAKKHLVAPWTELMALPPNQQAVLLQAAIEQKKGLTYLEFAISIFQKIAAGELPKQFGQMLLSPAASDKEGFIPINFSDEKLAKALRQLVPLYADAPERVVFIEKVLSGKARDEYLEWSSLQGVQPIQPISNIGETRQKLSPSISTSVPANSSPAHKSAQPKPAVASANYLPSRLWSIAIVLIVSASGLLLLLIKKRK